MGTNFYTTVHLGKRCLEIVDKKLVPVFHWATIMQEVGYGTDEPKIWDEYDTYYTIHEFRELMIKSVHDNSQIGKEFC